MHTFNIWTKLKENPTKLNGEIYILGRKNTKREDITRYMCILMVDSKTPIVYNLNKFFMSCIK